MRLVGTPIERAAVMYSVSRTERILARTRRHGIIQKSNPITRIVFRNPGPAAVATATKMTTGGKVIITSVNRMMIMSVLPPKKPAHAPSTIAMTTEISTASTPTSKRNTPGIDRARVDVATGAVGSEPVIQRRRLTARSQVDLIRIVLRHDGRKDRHQGDDQKDDQPGHRQFVAHEAPHDFPAGTAHDALRTQLVLQCSSRLQARLHHLRFVGIGGQLNQGEFSDRQARTRHRWPGSRSG